MKLISMFEESGTTYVKDEEGNTYALQKVPEPILPNLPITNKNSCNIDIDVIKNINNMLSKLKVPHYASYEVLVHCIYFVVKDEICRTRLYVNLYPKVARLHDIMASSVPGSFTTLVCHWGRTAEYKKIFGTKIVSPKNLILGLADYYLEHQ